MQPARPVEPAHILIIANNAAWRGQLGDILTEAGYRISTTRTAGEGLLYLQLLTPDLVIAELLLPDMSGQELMVRLKADVEKPFVSVILLAAHNDVQARVAALDAGADDVLAWPTANTELLARVRAALRLQRSQRSLRAEQRKTELLLHLTRELGGSLDLPVLLTRFLDHLADAVGAARASIILHDPVDDGAICYSSSRNTATPVLGEALRSGVAGWVMREQQPLMIADTHEDPRWVGREPYQRLVRSVAAMPVLHEEQAVGVITLVHHRPGYFTSEHIDLLSSVAAQSAVALESAQLYNLTRRQKELIERRAEELQRINEINQYLSELMRPDQLLRLVAHIVHHTFHYPLVTIFIRHGDELAAQAVSGSLGDGLAPPRRIPTTTGINGWVLANNRPLRVDDVQYDTRFFTPEPARSHTRAELAVPIVLQREVVGTLDAQSAEVGFFSQSDEALLATIASQLGVALGNARLLENEERRIRQLGLVNRLSLAITARFDAMRNLQTAADALATIFGVRQAGVALLDESGHGPRVALHGPPAPADDALRQALLNPRAHHLLQELREPLIVGDLQTDGELAVLHQFFAARGIESLVLVPLIVAGGVIGVIGIDATHSEQNMGSAELGLALNVASLIAQVVENNRLYGEVEEERTTLDAVLRGAADPILLIGPHDELLLANRAAHERLGINPAASGQPLLELLASPELLPMLTNGYAASGRPGEVTLPDGTTYSVSNAPLTNADGEPSGRVAVLQDITAIKELERQEQKRMRSVFQRYVSPEVAEQLLSAGESFGQPTERTVAVLFADLRGFTSLTERIGPHVLVERILNRYFTAMTEALLHYEGTIDKFLGDGVIGVFGSPISRPDDAQRAVLAGVHMQRSFAELRHAWQEELGLDIGMGVGISYGQAVVGNIGSEQRLDYTLIGDVVNTANRLSSLAQTGQVIASHHLVDALPLDTQEHWCLKRLGEVQLKGKQDLHLVYEVCYSDLARVVS